MKRNKLLASVLGFLSIFASSTVLAYDEPFVNLGYTSFLDGGPPSGPGWYLMNYFEYYNAHRFNDNEGNELPFPMTKLDVIADIWQLIFLSKINFLGGKLAYSAVLPTVLDVRMRDGLAQPKLLGTTGFGDLTTGPALQFDPIMRKNGKGPLYVQRFELDIIVPIGHYDRGYAIMPSSHFWSINPYWAQTLWLTEKWTISTRTHYLWNAKNRKPNVSFGPNVGSTQAGQAVFANIATEVSVTEKLHFGVNGYFFYQFTNTLVDGQPFRGREERVWAIGPGGLYQLTKNQAVFFNLYFEQGARNRSQGINGVLRYVLHFGKPGNSK